MVFEGRLTRYIDRLPNQTIKRDDDSFRCCIYKDRELVKRRTIAFLGFSLGDENDIDDTLLSDYAQIAIRRDKPTFPILTFLDEACKACVRTNYFVTNVCKNCVARPCTVNCPKNAISITNQANIDPDTCINWNM